MIVPDKFNMVDMDGIDLLFSYGDIIPGLYQKLVESITQCRYQCLYNWYFDGVLIPPTYVEMTVNQDTNDIWINDGIFVTTYDSISLDLPSLETVSGSVVNITNALSRRVKELICYINPLQSGSGDPSPSNIRPIIGFSEVNIFDEIEYDPSAEPKANVNWQNETGTVYGAALSINDDGSGELVVNRVYVLYDGSDDELWRSSSGNRLYIDTYLGVPIYDVTSAEHIRANWLRSVPANISTTFDNCIFVFAAVTDGIRLGVRIAPDVGVNEFRTMLQNTNLQVVYDLDPEYYLTYSFSSIDQLVTLLGTNTIWHDANGDISVTYWKE